MSSFQIQVVGLLDGATLFVPPAPLPAPVQGGVTKLTAAAAAGLFDLADLIGWQGPLLLSHYAIEPAALVRALRTTLDTPGAANDEFLIPDQGNLVAGTTPMQPYSLFPNAYLPSGSRIAILSDNTSAAFAGLPVAGPHFLFFDLQPLQNQGAIAAAMKACNFASAKHEAETEAYSSFQAVAASASADVAIIDFPANDLGRVWQLQSASVQLETAAAAGESMIVAVERVINTNGVSAVVATVTIDNVGEPADTMIRLTINQDTNQFLAGDRVRISRVYVAGVGPTMTTTLVEAHVSSMQV